MPELPPFDPDAKPLEERDPIPAGTYKCAIVASDVQATKTGAGQRLSLELQVLEGPHAGRKIFDGLNIVNASTKAQEIAHRQLAGYRVATGVMSPKRSEELHDRPFWCKVKIVAAQGDYAAKNEVVKVDPLSAQPAQQTQNPPANPPAANVPPWKRN